MIEQAIRADVLIGSTPHFTSLPAADTRSLPHVFTMIDLQAVYRPMVSYLYILALIPMNDLQCGGRRVEMFFGRFGRLLCGRDFRDCWLLFTSGSEYVSAIFVKDEKRYEVSEWSGALTVEE